MVGIFRKSAPQSVKPLNICLKKIRNKLYSAGLYFFLFFVDLESLSHTDAHNQADPGIALLSRVHVRRTDKVGTEAAFHPIEEYMVHVEDHYKSLAQRMHVDKKRVYLATDDPSLLQEAKSKWVHVL